MADENKIWHTLKMVRTLNVNCYVTEWKWVWIPTSCLRFKIMDLQPLQAGNNDFRMLPTCTKNLKFLCYIYCMVAEVMFSLSCQKKVTVRNSN